MDDSAASRLVEAVAWDLIRWLQQLCSSTVAPQHTVRTT